MLPAAYVPVPVGGAQPSSPLRTPPIVSNSSTSCLFLASIPRARLTWKAALLFGVFLDEYFILGRLHRVQQLLALSRLIIKEAYAVYGAGLLGQSQAQAPLLPSLPLKASLWPRAPTSGVEGTPLISLSGARKVACAERRGGIH